MKKIIPCLLSMVLLNFNFFSQKEPVTPHVSPALRFTENTGQWENNVLFRAQMDGGLLFMEKNGLTFNFYDKKKYRDLHHGGILKGRYLDNTIKAHAYKIHFENCNADALIEKMEQGSDYENFYIGNNPEKWKSNVQNYHRVFYYNLYNGINYEVITTTNGIKYNFHVKPGASVNRIKLKYEGVDNLKLVNGTLKYELEVNKVVEQKPYAYQMINNQVIEVKCNYTLKNNAISFEFPEGYNKNFELVIDPVLVFAAQSGSTADNFGMCATWDANGNFYSGGTVFDIGYPTTPGVYSINFNGPAANANTDVVITKYNSSGTSLLFSTYIGGNQSEIVTSLIVDHSNNLCFYGATGSANFPASAGAYDNSFNLGQSLSFVYNGTNFNNGTDIFVAKFNSNGTSLIGSTFLGGSNNDGVNHVNNQTLLPPPNPPILEYQPDSLQHSYGDQYRGEIQVDRIDNIYITSSTRSSNFPVVNAYDNSLGGQQDAIVAKFNSSLTQLVFSTYLGGNLNDCGNSLIINNNLEVYVTGGTSSANFPTTGGAYGTTYFGGIADGFISHLGNTGSILMQSTFIGSTGNNYDQSYFIQNDSQDNIYVYGQSLGNMPVIPSGTNTLYSNPGTHQFISRLNNTLSNLTMATVIGSSTVDVDISPSAFSVDKCGNIYLSGWGGNFIPPNTIMSNMPLASATQSTTDGNDFYLMSLSANASNLVYGSYFGGNISDEHVDGGTSRIDKNGRFYQSVCAGCGGRDDFPVSPGAWPNTPGDPNHSFNCNNGVFKIDAQPNILAANIGVSSTKGCAPFTATLSNVSPGTSNIWYLGNGNTSTVVTNPIITYTSPGVYIVSLVVFNPAACNQKDSSSLFISVGQPISMSVSVSGNTLCTGQSATLAAAGAPFYSWSTGAITSSIIVSPTVTTSYTVTGSNSGGCSISSVITQSVVICPGINELESATSIINVYPNPSNGQFYLSGNRNNTTLTIEIFDVAGKLILQTLYDRENKMIDLGKDAKGIYIVKAWRDKELILSKKISVQ